MKGQLEVLEAAFVHAHELAAQLQELSIEIDTQGAYARDVVQELKFLQEQADVIVVRLKQRFASPIPETVKKLLECFENFSHFHASVTGNESNALLGTKLKYQTLDTIWNIQNIYHSLNVT